MRRRARACARLNVVTKTHPHVRTCAFSQIHPRDTATKFISTHTHLPACSPPSSHLKTRVEHTHTRKSARLFSRENASDRAYVHSPQCSFLAFLLRKVDLRASCGGLGCALDPFCVLPCKILSRFPSRPLGCPSFELVASQRVAPASLSAFWYVSGELHLFRLREPGWRGQRGYGR